MDIGVPSGRLIGGRSISVHVISSFILFSICASYCTLSKEPCPFLPAPSELRCHLFGHLCIHFGFGWHSVLSSFQFCAKEKQETSRDLLLHIMLDMLYFVVSRSIEIHIRHHFRIAFCFHLCSCLIHAIKLTINAIKDIIQGFKKISCLYEIKSFIKRKIHLHTI